LNGPSIDAVGVAPALGSAERRQIVRQEEEPQRLQHEALPMP
jgi:hypothetical protein